MVVSCLLIPVIPAVSVDFFAIGDNKILAVEAAEDRVREDLFSKELLLLLLLLLLPIRDEEEELEWDLDRGRAAFKATAAASDTEVVVVLLEEEGMLSRGARFNGLLLLLLCLINLLLELPLPLVLPTIEEGSAI